MAVLVIAACTQPSRNDKISATSDTTFELWIAKRSKLFTPADIKEINTARQQIRYMVMQSRPGMMSDEFAVVLYAEINGKTIHELLLTSYALQIQRIKTELLNYQPQLERFQEHEQNKHLSEDQKKTVSDALEKLHRLMRGHQEELARLNARLAELERQAAVS